MSSRRDPAALVIRGGAGAQEIAAVVAVVAALSVPVRTPPARPSWWRSPRRRLELSLARPVVPYSRSGAAWSRSGRI